MQGVKMPKQRVASARSHVPASPDLIPIRIARHPRRRLDLTAGQAAWDEQARLAGVGDVKAQKRQVLSNIASVLTMAGASLTDVLKCNVYRADMR
jgi:enamine deaminase RidA (YjgF/YER057c/UK114 family)